MLLYEKHRQLISRSRRLIQAGTAMTAALIIAAAAAIFMLRLGAIADTQDDNHRLGVVLAEQTSRTIQSVDLVLQEFVEKVASASNGSAGHLDELFGSRDVHEALTKRLTDLPQAEAFALIDATGHIVNVTRQWPPPDYSLADRDYFQYFAKTPDPGPYLAAPSVSRSSGASTTFLVRRLTAPDGSFLGVIEAPILIKYFDSVLARAGFTDGTAVTILRSDGTVLVRFPSHGIATGSHIKPNTAWFTAVASGGGQYVSPGLLSDSLPSFVSVHPLANYPVVVDVSRSKAAALARWWRQSLAIFLSVAAAALSQAMLLKTLARQMTLMEESHHRIDEQVAIIQASEKRLAGQTDLLETTLRHMNQGLIMVDAEGSIAVCNRRAMQLLDLPAEMMENHPRVTDVIAFQTQRGDFEVSAELKADPSLLLTNNVTYERHRPDGTVIEIHSVPLPDGGLVRTYTDITVRVATEKMLGHAASHDPLTGLANRNGFAQRLDAALIRAQRSNTRLALLCLDLDDFKAVNDRMGHAAGDKVLILAADRMRACSRADDIVGRLGGDEFAIILPGASLAGAAHACQRLLEAVRKPYPLGEETACVGVSIGIAIYPTDGADAEQLHRNADIALYKAKEAGRNTWRAYVNEDLHREAMHRLLQQDVRAAVSLNQFTSP